MLVIVASIACAMGLMLGLSRRADAHRHLAAYHEQAAAYLCWEEVGPVCLNGDGSREHLESMIRHRGERAWLAYLAAEYHEREASRCAEIANRPWIIKPAETRPALADPKFDFDPYLPVASLDEPSLSMDGEFR